MARVESALLPADHAVSDNSDTETSGVVECDSAVVEEVEKRSAEVGLQVPFGTKEDVESLGTVCDLGNKGNDAEAVTPNGVTLELLVSSKSPGGSLPMVCKTPRGNIFDPFASGQEEAVCGAPKKVVVKGPEALSRRKLIFECGDFPVKSLSFEFDDAVEEDVYLQGICKMFLDLIITNQALEATGGGDQAESTPPESYQTPSSKPLLTGIADTCPDAPPRPSQKMLKLSPGICRKLDFGSVSPRSLFTEDNKS
ncbi:uncharacterized protein LOC100838513 [Brachypodium distachyon]|uniref:Uncharacterized protein n=1 Tax=Brachypodium distachyon TaxID=15368 RepID=I1IUZ1_BRADI|nr:uncharacterized protein LOC100838513 [Brachypodium distachyon]KQJ92530.1 hypothetical protein BRADI_4g44260v3 [Brachypodium distachyon]|eukprot:XP_003577130.1 uncharacterized protein LOC100838513 [Brachypodium distachyon]